MQVPPHLVLAPWRSRRDRLAEQTTRAYSTSSKLFLERNRLLKVSHENALASRVRMPAMRIPEFAWDNGTRLLALSGLWKRNFGHGGHAIRANLHPFESLVFGDMVCNQSEAWRKRSGSEACPGIRRLSNSMDLVAQVATRDREAGA